MHKKKKINHLRKRRGKNTRMTIPFNTLCIKCNYTMPKGKKVYANRLMSEEKYLGVDIFLFEFLCLNCKSNITIKTDPKDGTYKAEINCKEIKSIFENEIANEEIKSKSKIDIEELKNRIINKFYK